MSLPHTGSHYHAQLGLSDKDRVIKGFVVCNKWDQEHLDRLNGLAKGCFQPSPEVWLVLYIQHTLKGKMNNTEGQRTFMSPSTLSCKRLLFILFSSCFRCFLSSSLSPYLFEWRHYYLLHDNLYSYEYK